MAEFMPIFDIRARRNTPLNRCKPLELYGREEFRQRYRLSKECFTGLVEELLPDLERSTNRSHALKPDDMLSSALRFYATGSFQSLIGDHAGISQPSLSRIISEVTDALNRRLSSHIYLPRTDDEIAKVKDGFRRLAQFPRVVIGAIDGSMFRIQAPSGDQEPYYVCRKGFHSINGMAMCDSDGRFTCVSNKFPGSAHDSRVFKSSALYEKAERGDLPGIMIGDSGYAAAKYMLTPFPNGQDLTDAQERYNSALCKTRFVIECTFGRLKRRFHSLHAELRIPDTAKICKIITACQVLHNICLRWNEEEFEEEEFREQGQDHDRRENDAQAEGTGGLVFRNRFVDRYFNVA